MPSVPAAKIKMKPLQLPRLYHYLIPCLVFLTTVIPNALSSDVFFEDAIEDGAYLRREHCLKKPYHGENIMSFYPDCFNLLPAVHCRHRYV